MKKQIKNWIYKIATKVVAKRLVDSNEKLTPDYLTKRGWVTEFDEVRQKTFYVEPNVKDRDKISVEFESHYYRVWHSEKRTFIALENNLEWFEWYYLLSHPARGLSKLAGR